MRTIATLHPQDSIPVNPDTVQTMLIAGSSGQAMDWPTGSTAGGRIVRFTGQSTAGIPMPFCVNLMSTKCAAPSTSVSTEGTTGFNIPVMYQGAFQVLGASTGWSAAGLTSGYIQAEIWNMA